MIRSRIVEVYGALDESETQNAGVEIEVFLWVACYTSDVVDTGGPETHRTDSCLTSCRRLAMIRAGAGRAPLARRAPALSLLLSRWHTFANHQPLSEATDVLVAEVSVCGVHSPAVSPDTIDVVAGCAQRY